MSDLIARLETLKAEYADAHGVNAVLREAAAALRDRDALKKDLNLVVGQRDWATKQLHAVAADRDALAKERDHWRANHDQMVERNAFLRERPDLPVDRIPTYERMKADRDALARDLAAARGLLQDARDHPGDPYVADRIDAILAATPEREPPPRFAGHDAEPVAGPVDPDPLAGSVFG